MGMEKISTVTAAPAAAPPPWHSREAAGILEELGSHASRGLEESEAAARLARNGPNALPAGKGVGPATVLLRQFKSLIVWVLIVASAVSAFLGETVDAAAILIIVILNAIIGFYQEYSAEKSIAALRKMSAPSAKVRRGGKAKVIPASEVVTGDLVELEAGDWVPADARILECAEMRCVEAALTGESEAVAKDPDALPGEKLPLGDRRNMA
jgi:Ca2+-transporting ATPase